MAKRNLEEEIQERIKQCRISRGDEWWIEFFNNFNYKLPGGFRVGDSKSPAGCHPRSSERMKLKTLGEFYDEVDRVIEEVGFSIDEIERMNEFTSKRRASKKDFFKIVFPVYRRLREYGYNHYPDLTS